MITPRLTTCGNCTTIPALLGDINCAISNISNNQYDNITLSLGKPSKEEVMFDLLNYQRILTYKYFNSDYALPFDLDEIISRVKILTVDCKSKCKCKEASLPPLPITITTSTTSSTTTTSTTAPVITTTTTTLPPIIGGYGLLYNWYAATDERNIAPVGWHVPNNAEWQTLIDYLGGENVAGGKLKETGFTHWDIPNTGATNETLFSGFGSGCRTASGISLSIKRNSCHWCNSEQSGYGDFFALIHDISGSRLSYIPKTQGISIRYIKNDSTLVPTVAGNDGQVYKCVKIGDQVWTAENSVETKYRNGDLIPEVTDNTEWSNLETGALCAYNNDWNYV